MQWKQLELYTTAVQSSGNSRSSQDGLLSPFPARCWPEAFHANSFTRFRETGKIGYDGGDAYRYQYQHHHAQLPTTTTSPPTLTEQDVVGGKKK